MDDSSPHPVPRWRRAVNFLVWLAIDQWFIIAMALLIVISSQVQVPLSQQHVKQTVVTYLAVAIIFFITGCTLKTRVLLENYYRWPVHLFIQVQCFLVTSAIVFGVVSAAASNPNFMDPGLLVGWIFLGSVPTTLSSNVVMTGQAHGNTALTVVQTTIGNFIGPFISPLLIKMYTSTGAWYTDYLQVAEEHGGGFGEVYRRVFMQLGLSVYLPMVVGQLVQNVFPKATAKIMVDWHIKRVGSFALLLIIWQTFDQAFATGAFSSVKPDNIIFIVFMSIAFYIVWLVICVATSLPWLPKRDVISVAYCVPAKTPAIGVPLSNVMYAGLSLLTESKMQIPMVLFQGLQITFSSLLTIAFRKWIAPDEAREAAEEREKRTQSPDEGALASSSASVAETAVVSDGEKAVPSNDEKV